MAGTFSVRSAAVSTLAAMTRATRSRHTSTSLGTTLSTTASVVTSSGIGTVDTPPPAPQPASMAHKVALRGVADTDP